MLDGKLDGLDDGVLDGKLDGSDDGVLDGKLDGSSDGALDGEFDGSDDGVLDGDELGWDDGISEGYELGNSDGADDGIDDGTHVFSLTFKLTVQVEASPSTSVDVTSNDRVFPNPYVPGVKVSTIVGELSQTSRAVMDTGLLANVIVVSIQSVVKISIVRGGDVHADPSTEMTGGGVSCIKVEIVIGHMLPLLLHPSSKTTELEPKTV